MRAYFAARCGALGCWSVLQVFAWSGSIAKSDPTLSANLRVYLELFQIDCNHTGSTVPVQALLRDAALTLDNMPGVAVTASPHTGLDVAPADAGVTVEVALGCVGEAELEYAVTAWALPDRHIARRVTGTSTVTSADLREKLAAAVLNVIGQRGSVTETSSAALDAYLAGTESTPYDTNLLHRAVDLDPTFAPAAIRIGEHELRLGEQGGQDARDHYRSSEKSLERALLLQPESPLATYFLASVYMRTGRTVEAIALLRKGIELRPDSARLRAKLGYALRYAGFLDRSIEEYRVAQSLDSTYHHWVQCERQIIKSLIYSGQADAAAESFAKIVDRLHVLSELPDEKMLFYQGLARMYAGDRPGAIVLFNASLDSGTSSVWSDFASAYRAAANGDLIHLVALTDRLENGNVSDGERRYRLAHLNAIADRPDKALHHLEIAAQSGFFSYTYTQKDKFLGNIRDLDDFDRILSFIKARHLVVAERYQ